MTKIYTIDQSKVSALTKRLLMRGVRILLLTFLAIIALQYFANGMKDFNIRLFSMVITIPVLAIGMFRANRKLSKSYSSLEIVLNDKEVERKAELMPYRKIQFANLLIVEKSNGTINLYDNSVSAFKRKFNGEGWIMIPPEIMNRETLLIDLNNKIMRG